MNRQVNINIAYDNQLYLDQITQDSSAVWIQDTKSNITRLANNSNSINSTDQDSLDGDYRFSLQAYSPTTDTATYHIPPGNTLSLNITATVAGLL
jgi:flagellar basal body L-ring protein FlgH